MLNFGKRGHFVESDHGLSTHVKQQTIITILI